MDRTTFFKACVKAIKTRNKGMESTKMADCTIIKTSTRIKTEFGSKATELKKNVSELRKFLLKCRKDYIDAISHLGTSVMSDHERDQIDQDSQKIIRTCSNAIKILQDNVINQKNSEQVTEHRKIVLEILEKYLKETCKLYSEQKAIRVKRVVDKKRISRLQRDSKLNNSLRKENNFVTTSFFPDQDNNSGELNNFTAEEIQTFEQENKRMLDEMNSMVNEVRNIEGRVVEIAKLQEVFSEKVLEQSKQIDRVYETTVKTTENVKDGNENIREAIKNNASFRVWILFFLVMCSFSLLFLDWYS